MNSKLSSVESWSSQRLIGLLALTGQLSQCSNRLLGVARRLKSLFERARRGYHRCQHQELVVIAEDMEEDLSLAEQVVAAVVGSIGVRPQQWWDYNPLTLLMRRVCCHRPKCAFVEQLWVMLAKLIRTMESVSDVERRLEEVNLHLKRSTGVQWNSDGISRLGNVSELVLHVAERIDLRILLLPLCNGCVERSVVLWGLRR